MTRVDLIQGHTWHGRKDGPKNAFRYSIDYVLFDPEAHLGAPALFSRDRFNAMSVRDLDHGGAPGKGRGAKWLRDVLAENGLDFGGRVLLLTQPRVFGYVFNPVSFWLCHDSEDRLRVVVAEVTNTFGDRHCYLCHRDDCAPITDKDRLEARKLMHVSPFQPVEGGYTFRFDLRDDRIGIWIDYGRGNGGLLATLTGRRVPLTNRRILGALLRHPFGARRVMALIHWQAFKLWWKGALYRARPVPPAQDVSR